MTIRDIKEKNSLLLNCISGSRAYNLHTPQSDTDKKGVFILPRQLFYGLTYTEQVNNETNDEVYFELKRFMDLLLKNNPNILELLNTPADCILYKHPVMDLLKPELFLSKLCKETFAGYAQSQIKKAKGLNKKIMNPVEKERKTVLDFCYVLHQQGSLSLKRWLEKKKFQQEDCGLIRIDHMRDMYAIFHNHQLSNGYLKGIYSGPDSNDILLSSVEKGLAPVGSLYFNKDGYSIYCKDYKEYWDWVENRNDNRYRQTIEHGKNYDAKNMMHTFRLLYMAEEIAKEGKVNVRRPDREFLLEVKSGNYTYDELLMLANEKIKQIDFVFEQCGLPEQPDVQKAEAVLVEMRERLYME